MKGNNRGTGFFWSDRFLIPVSALLAALLIYMAIDVHNDEVRSENELKQVMEKEAAETAARVEAEKEHKYLEENDSFYQRLTDGFPVRIMVIGDSIAGGRGASDRAHTWHTLLENRIEETYGVDVGFVSEAMNDNTAYGGYVKAMTVDAKADPDLVIVCFGEDDKTANFGIYYESILRALQAKYPDASLMTVIENASRYETENNRTVRTLSEHYGIPCADALAEAEASEAEYDILLDPVGYPTDEGQKVYADAFFRTIEAEAAGRRGKDSTDTAALYAETSQFEKLDIYPADKFEREGNTFTLEVPAAGLSGRILGIDYDYVTGTNSCLVFADSDWTIIGQASFQNTLNYNGDELNGSGRRHYRVLNTWITDWGTMTAPAVNASTWIRVVFPETENGTLQADSFRNLLLSKAAD